MFPLIRHYNAVRGNFDPKVRKYFEYYDTDALRIAPDEVLFNNAQAWQDIMGHGRTPQMPKAKRGHRKEGSNIIIANDTDHARFRRALSHAFSERALKEQEPLLQRYVDLLVERLNEKADSGEAADMTTLYTFTTFDIIVIVLATDLTVCADCSRAISLSENPSIASNPGPSIGGSAQSQISS